MKVLRNSQLGFVKSLVIIKLGFSVKYTSVGYYLIFKVPSLYRIYLLIEQTKVIDGNVLKKITAKFISVFI